MGAALRSARAAREHDRLPPWTAKLADAGALLNAPLHDPFEDRREEKDLHGPREHRPREDAVSWIARKRRLAFGRGEEAGAEMHLVRQPLGDLGRHVLQP